MGKNYCKEKDKSIPQKKYQIYSKEDRMIREEIWWYSMNVSLPAIFKNINERSKKSRFRK